MVPLFLSILWEWRKDDGSCGETVHSIVEIEVVGCTTCSAFLVTQHNASSRFRFDHVVCELTIQMNIPEYNTELVNNLVYNLDHLMPGNNESYSSAFDYLYDSTDNNFNHSSLSHAAGSQHLASILQQLFFKISDNGTSHNSQPSSSGTLPSSSGSSGALSPSLLSIMSYRPVSSSDAESFRLLSIISLWFVLIINPILVNTLVNTDWAKWLLTLCFPRSFSASSVIC